jgi:hypothetical protein
MTLHIGSEIQLRHEHADLDRTLPAGSRGVIIMDDRHPGCAPGEWCVYLYDGDLTSYVFDSSGIEAAR